jgi:hypothetical protein
LSSSAITRRSGICLGNSGFQKFGEDLRRRLLAHEFHNIRCGHRSGIGKTIQERSDAKEMVAVTVGDINRCQVLAARRDPIYEDVRLLDGDKGVDEDGVSLARNKCRRYR